jgi:hypothetical protein
MTEDTEPYIIEAEEDDGFQEYKFQSGKKVKGGTPIGVEVFNPRTKEIELHLFNDIMFSDEPREETKYKKYKE